MALNKFMHPRNIYKNPPDFGKLAKSFEEFSSITKLDLTGKVTIDFKDPNSLRVLTRCLLKSDFNLDVSIPEDRLVPTLPLRLNYVLWVEDLLNYIHRMDDVWGIDIGTGACAIYPLLAAAKNKWHMVGTETDSESVKKAVENVNKNNLQDLIEVRRNPTESILEHMFDKENMKNYDFCMCNPPFYSNIEELCESRSPARLPPKNGFTGSPQELITEGGELTFCRKIINESVDLQNRILIYTTMVGHKYNMRELVQDLKAEGIKHTTMEFCQGRVTRWGLAWTYQDYDLSTMVPGRDKPRKKMLPVTYILPALPNIPYNIDTVSNKVKCMLQHLEIENKIINKRGNNITMDVKAMSNTWSNQRRKRRLMKRLETDEVKKLKLDKHKNSVTEGNDNQDSSDSIKDLSELEKLQELKTNDSNKNLINGTNFNKQETAGNGDTAINIESNANVPSATECSRPEAGPNSYSVRSNFLEREVLVHAFMKLMKKEKDIILEMEYLNGSAGKEGLHQIVQYIKNNWEYKLFHLIPYLLYQIFRPSAH